MNLAEKLLYLRKEKKLSQLALAEMINVSRQAISRWEVGEAAPSIENLNRLSSIYGVSLDYLLNDKYREPEKAIDSLTGKNKQNDNHWANRKMIIVFAIIILGILTAVSVYIATLKKHENTLPMNEIKGDEIVTDSEQDFDLEW